MEPSMPPPPRPSASTNQWSRPQRPVFSLSRTTSSTPHPSAGIARSQTSLSQYVPSSSSYSVTASSYPSVPHRNASSVSGRKSRAMSSAWGSESHQVICAVSEARGVSPTVGLAFVNATTNEAVLSQICDSQFYVKTLHKIQVYEPSVILMVNTAFPPHAKSSLLSIIEEELHGTPIQPLDRKYWSENGGLDSIQTLAFREDIDAIKLAIQGNFYATCSFAAVIKYMQHSLNLTIMSQSLRVKYQPSENSMLVDISTIHSLELIQNLQNAKSRDCLFGLLNQTLTPMGSRMLRSNILQPSTQAEHTLTPRYDALDELTMKEDMFLEVRQGLGLFKDAEQLLTKLVIVSSHESIYDSERAINNVLLIKDFVLAVPPIYEALGSARTDLLMRIRQVCRPELTQPVADLIAATINEDVRFQKTPMDLRHQRTYAVKAGVHGLLDVARQTYREGVDDVHQLAEDINERDSLSIEVKYDEKRKYFFRLSNSDLEGPLPDDLINRVRNGRFLEFQTLPLVQLNNRITDSHDEAVMLSDSMVQRLLDSIRGHIADMFRVCEGIALLDMITAFAQTVTTRDYVRPEIGDTLALKAARHPIRETMMQQGFVPNDVYASSQHRFQIITGCNMSGKSTYIRMITLLQVMAQIGCFVPADYAAFPIIHQLLVRISTDDSIEANMSTFSMEMREMAFILRNINGDSMVIIDELGRGTSTRDGLAIALAMSEALVQSGSLVWFVTHFHQLSESPIVHLGWPSLITGPAKVLGTRPGVLNLHLATDVSRGEEGETPRMTMLYKINSGPLEQEHYGLDLARVIGFPARFIRVAEEVSNTLREQVEKKKQSSEARRVLLRRNLVLSLHETLQQLRSSDMDNNALGSYLKRLQNEFVVRMTHIGQGERAESEDVARVESEEGQSEPEREHEGGG